MLINISEGIEDSEPENQRFINDNNLTNNIVAFSTDSFAISNFGYILPDFITPPFFVIPSNSFRRSDISFEPLMKSRILFTLLMG